MNATSSETATPRRYLVCREGVFRALDDGTYVRVPKPTPMPAGASLSEFEIEARRGYWGALKERFHATS